MHSQRVREAESRTERRQANGSRRAQGTAVWLSILRRAGIRQLPGICWYPAKCAALRREARWHREWIPLVLDSIYQGRAFFYAIPSRNRRISCIIHRSGRPGNWLPPESTGKSLSSGSFCPTSLRRFRRCGSCVHRITTASCWNPPPTARAGAAGRSLASSRNLRSPVRTVCCGSGPQTGTPPTAGIPGTRCGKSSRPIKAPGLPDSRLSPGDWLAISRMIMSSTRSRPCVWMRRIRRNFRIWT